MNRITPPARAVSDRDSLMCLTTDSILHLSSLAQALTRATELHLRNAEDSTGDVRMRSSRWWARSSAFSILLAVVCCTCVAHGQATPQKEDATTAAGDSAQVLQTLDQLVEQNHRLEQQNRELMNQIEALRQTLAKDRGRTAEAGSLQRSSGEVRCCCAASGRTGKAPAHCHQLPPR